MKLRVESTYSSKEIESSLTSDYLPRISILLAKTGKGSLYLLHNSEREFAHYIHRVSPQVILEIIFLIKALSVIIKQEL